MKVSTSFLGWLLGNLWIVKMPKCMEIGKRYLRGARGEQYICSNQQSSGSIQQCWYNGGAVSRRPGAQTPTTPYLMSSAAPLPPLLPGFGPLVWVLGETRAFPGPAMTSWGPCEQPLREDTMSIYRDRIDRVNKHGPFFMAAWIVLVRQKMPVHLGYAYIWTYTYINIALIHQEWCL